jgi:putative endonuclease
MNVYIINSKIRDWTYVGITKNLEKRLIAHNNGKVLSTKSYRPLELKYYEQVEDYKSARKLEKYYKSNAGKEYLKRRGII